MEVQSIGIKTTAGWLRARDNISFHSMGANHVLQAPNHAPTTWIGADDLK